MIKGLRSLVCQWVCIGAAVYPGTCAVDIYCMGATCICIDKVTNEFNWTSVRYMLVILEWNVTRTKCHLPDNLLASFYSKQRKRWLWTQNCCYGFTASRPTICTQALLSPPAFVFLVFFQRFSSPLYQSNQNAVCTAQIHNYMFCTPHIL